LNDIGTGGHCRVVALHGRGPVRQRLMDLGLVPNARLQVVRSAPLDDPVEVRIEDTFLTLRRAEAAHVQVTDV
jgi:Fe2+ transport system protein FeoA